MVLKAGGTGRRVGLGCKADKEGAGCRRGCDLLARGLVCAVLLRTGCWAGMSWGYP